MPPKKKLASADADDDSDSGKWMKAHDTMQNLRKEREKKFSSVIKDTHQELEDLFSEREEKKKTQLQESVKEQAKHINTLIDSTERRKQIEEEIQDIVTQVQGRAEEFEQMMLVGYEGRLAQMQQAFEDRKKANSRQS